MSIRAIFTTMLALLALACSSGAWAQRSAKPTTEQELKEMLIWSSPWEGRATTPPGLYSHRMVFRQRRDVLVAEVTSLATNQRSDSIVSIRDGTISWQDANGADVNVALGDAGELIGTAKTSTAQLPIAIRPRR